ncbi:MAG: hypothetical protein E7376_02090 [Clostridiales bacterium]|nr:hypothetical protein [Clostridiales bacterium]
MNLILAKMSNLMFGASQLVRDPVTGEKDLGDFNWVYDIVDVINAVMWPLLIIVAAAGTIYAVVLGVNMARADSTEKREEAKKRVINVLVGMAIIVGLVLLLKLFISQLPNWIPTPEA